MRYCRAWGLCWKSGYSGSSNSCAAESRLALPASKKSRALLAFLVVTGAPAPPREPLRSALARAGRPARRRCDGASRRSARSSTRARPRASRPTASASPSSRPARAWICSRPGVSSATRPRPRALPRSRSSAPPSSFAASSWPGSICPIVIATTSGASPSARPPEPFAWRSSGAHRAPLRHPRHRAGARASPRRDRSPLGGRPYRRDRAAREAGPQAGGPRAVRDVLAHPRGGARHQAVPTAHSRALPRGNAITERPCAGTGSAACSRRPCSADTGTPASRRTRGRARGDRRARDRRDGTGLARR